MVSSLHIEATGCFVCIQHDKKEGKTITIRISARHLLALIIFFAIAEMFAAAGIATAQGPGSGPRAPAALAGTGFTYQGQLKNNGALVNANCDFQFGLWDGTASGPQYGSTQTVSSLAVAYGLFTTLLDFGVATPNIIFTGTARYLQSAVRCPTGGGLYTALSPRQALTPAPYALALPGMFTQQNATSPNVIGGFSGNIVSNTLEGGTIGGGGFTGAPNQVWASYANVSGGYSNKASGFASNIAGGTNNTAGNFYAVVSGGYSNNANNDYANIGGGFGNSAGGMTATISGGRNNIANGNGAFIGGGKGNSAIADFGSIVGGTTNNASGNNSTIGGGNNNSASNLYATVGGGTSNTASSTTSTVGGGNGNTASNSNSTIGGGINNTAGGDGSTIAGGRLNSASSLYTTVSGGYSNTVTGQYGNIGGGLTNTASGGDSTVGGGQTNNAGGDYASIGGGIGNTASGHYSTISGGNSNTASGYQSTVPGGEDAVASHYGEMAFASGRFGSFGDAQASTYVLRNNTSTVTPTEIYLDGNSASQRLTVASGRTLVFDILVVGRRDSNGNSAGYSFVGVIENVGGTTTALGVVKTVITEDDATWDVNVTADNTNDSLKITVTGPSGTVRWVAVVHTAEVAN